jgi:acyl carrier protein
MSVSVRILEYLNEGRLQPIEGPDELLHLDSLQFIRFSAFLREELELDISDDELTLENFDTMRSIEAFLARKAQSVDKGAQGQDP